MSDSVSYPTDCDEATVPDAAPGQSPAFQLHGSLRQLHAEGCRRPLPSGPLETLDGRVAAFFAAPDAAPQPLVGLLPFDPSHGDALYQPRHLLDAAPDSGAPLPAHSGMVAADPTTDAWAGAVGRCIADLQPGSGHPDKLRKVVLARSLRVETRVPINVHSLARRLNDDASVTTYVAPLPVQPGETLAWLVGATPELLVSRRGDVVVSNPLAGSAPRSTDPEQDAAAASALLASAKDLDEHRYVVSAIVDALAPLCLDLHAPPQPSLQATRTMWHLGTRIEGRLKNPSVSVATLAALLHPTPAVCGTPRQQALDTIRSLETVDRDFYAGAVGWVNAAGDGDWYLSIRCARVQGRTVRLFAGAGIVADSQPALEVAETRAKFGAMLDALGIDGPQRF